MVPIAKLIVMEVIKEFNTGKHLEHQRIFCISRNHFWPSKLILRKGGGG